jgi:hypothetical protein
MIPIFIGGTGRSGTTILKRVLAQHPKIASIPVELRVIIDPRGILDLKLAITECWSPYNADFAIQSFREIMLECESTSILKKIEIRVLSELSIAPARYASVGLGQLFGRVYYRERLNRLIGDLSYHVSQGSWDGTPTYQIPARIYETEPMNSGEVSSLIREFFCDLFRQRKIDSTHWIDDTPYNLLHVRDLLEIFPNLRFIHIFRDLRDVLASHRYFRWGGDEPSTIARRIASIMKRWFHIRELLPESSYKEIGLEALSLSPIDNIADLCAFIGVDFDENLKSSLKRIDPASVHAGRWKSELSSKQLDAVLPFLEQYLEAYDYEV